ncbi:LptF/LptG family permease [Stakelama marina]|uniref:LptF/LptG family permease n=1 Tax=Stakelama marina TaxID=2826939 RepID=A0A8T4IFA0_9SPHN|nr:LptF/LptG family permease [Stakelama marina]MBR0551725.1 LptF/LptG family permease [Stakelama marina]
MTLDRLVGRQILRRFTATFIVVVALLLVEHLPSLLHLSEAVNDRARFVTESLVALVPEYAGLALTLGLFVGTAFTIRALGQRSELDIFAAIGVSDLRLLRTPLLIGLITAIASLAIQFQLQPAGEHWLLQTGKRLAEGEYGLGLKPHEMHHPAPGISLTYDRTSPDQHAIEGIFVRRKGVIFSAKRGSMSLGAGGAWDLDLSDGVMLDGTNRGLRFDHLSLSFPSGQRPAETVSKDDRWATMNLQDLASRAFGSASPSERNRALGEIGARATMAWFILLLPLLSYILGVPAKRSGGIVGIAIGLVLIVLAIRGSDFVRHAGGFAAPGVYALAWGILALLLLHLHRRLGPGFIERASERSVRFARPLLVRMSRLLRSGYAKPNLRA